MFSLIEFLLVVALVLALYLLNTHREDVNILIKDPFKEKWANELYKMSYQIPFKWFVDEEKDKKAKEIKTMLSDANLRNRFNYRSYTAFRLTLFIGSIVVFLFLSVIFDNSQTVARILFNIPSVDITNNTASAIRQYKEYTVVLLVILNLLPNIMLRKRAKTQLIAQLTDIPVIQLFIVLMLRARRPIADILFALSKINTHYKEVFDNGYRVYLRNKEDGLEYIKERFGESPFKETVNVLKEMGEYSREDSIKLLENNMAQIIEHTNSLKRRNNLTSSVFSQGTIAIPFTAIILLGLFPVAIWAISLFNRVTGLGL